MDVFKSFFIALFALGLVACGGGGSGSGGGSSVTTIYLGSESLTLGSAGVPPTTSVIGITITITGNMVTISDAEGTSGTAPMSADGMSFIVPIRFPIVVGGVSCSFEVIHTGMISGASITGTLSGTSPCSGAGLSFIVTSSGTFSATQSSSAKSLNGSGFAGALREFL